VDGRVGGGDGTGENRNDDREPRQILDAAETVRELGRRSAPGEPDAAPSGTTVAASPKL
jgi:hypothetical protein